MDEHVYDLQGWISRLGRVDVPVLRKTARALATLREEPARVDARSIAQVVTRDPLMTVKVLRHFQRQRSERQLNDVVQVEQAVMMLGLEAFFTNVRPEPLVEDMLRGNVDALMSLVRVVRRSQRASRYAAEWAARLLDLRWEEVRIAALLHDIAELLMWCFAPDKMLAISAAQQRDPTLRSKAVQEQMLGFPLLDMQRVLAREWRLSALLVTLMDDACAQQPRVRNVVLAVNLARHSANGWDDATLPDDYKEIGELLRLPGRGARARRCRTVRLIDRRKWDDARPLTSQAADVLGAATGRPLSVSPAERRSIRWRRRSARGCTRT